MNQADNEKLYALIEQETRAEIMARLCPFFDYAHWGQAHYDAIECRDKIRELVFGTSDLVALATRWKMPIGRSAKKPEPLEKLKLLHLLKKGK